MKQNIPQRYKIVFWSTIVWGIFAHGYMYFNKLSWHDDMTLYSTGNSFIIGRWFLGFLGWCRTKLMGIYSLSVYNGLISLLLIALTGILLVYLFDIKSKVNCILIGAIIIVFPSITGLYGYMFVAAYDSLAIFLATLAVVCIKKYRNKYVGVVCGIIVIMLSLGLYQGYLPYVMILCVSVLVSEIVDTPEKEWYNHFHESLKHGIMIIGGLGGYFVVNKIVIGVLNIDLTDYQNADSIGKTNVSMLLKGIVRTYSDLLSPPSGTRDDMFMQSMRSVYYVLIILSAILIGCAFYKILKRNTKTAIWFLLLCLCLPVAMNAIYLMGEIPTVHSVMVYAKVMVFIFPIVLLERVTFRIDNIHKILKIVTVVIVGYSLFFYSHYANECYLKAQFQQSATISWMTALVSNIKGVDGYSDELSVAYINERNIDDETFYASPYFSNITINPYDYTSIYNVYTWRSYLRHWCGFKPNEVLDISDIEQWQEVLDMPSYPDDGAIKVINDIVVVKF